MLSSGKVRGGGNKGRTRSIPRGSCQPPGQWGRRPRAHAPHKAPRAHAPPCGASRRVAQAACKRSTCTLPRLTGTPGPPGAGGPGPGTPRSTHTCAHARIRTPRPRGRSAAPAAQTHCTLAARSYCLPRLYADASERDGRQDARPHNSWGRPRGGGGAPPRSPIRTPSRAHPPRTHCWPLCGCG